jgi:CDP-paratose 2-epimerase
MRVLVTGGAGFVGASVATGLAARHPEWELTALDNLRRRGAELNLGRLREAGVAFVHGASPAGIAEDFPLEGARTIYGATKLAAELLIEEYRATYGLRAVVNRCGVIAGPWQMGEVDQGVFTYWLLAHHFRRSLCYIGFGGQGKQVRDLLHVDDLVALLDEQLCAPSDWDGVTANVGGGPRCSLSLMETTALCQEITGNRVDLAGAAQSRAGDVPLYISNCARLSALSAWRPPAWAAGDPGRHA